VKIGPVDAEIYSADLKTRIAWQSIAYSPRGGYRGGDEGDASLPTSI